MGVYTLTRHAYGLRGRPSTSGGGERAEPDSHTCGGQPADPVRRRFLRWLPLRLLDVAALLCSLGIAGAITRWVLGSRSGRAVIRVTAANATWLLRPEEDQVLDVTGPLGSNRIVVRGGEVFVESAPCANQICVKTGTASRPGQWIACLPNRVFVAVEGGGDERIDARSY